MNNSAEKILYRKAALIFEELGFLMPRPDGGCTPEGEYTNAAVVFRGPFSGYLTVSLSTEILSQLSSNMLGDESKSTEAMQHDSLKEIANVICGNALPAIYGFEPIFNLDAPIICDSGFTMDGGAQHVPAAQVQMAFDVGSAQISLFVESTAPAASLQ